MNGKSVLLMLLALLTALPVLPSQSDSGRRKEIQAITIEQKALTRRLLSLRSKMSRLRERLLKEDREFAAELLAQGIEAVDKMNLETQMNAVIQDLEQDHRFASLQKQEQLIAQLTQLLQILLNRKENRADAELNALRKAIEEVRRLEERQAELKQQTEQLNDSLTDGELQRLGELAKELEALRAAQDQQLERNQKTFPAALDRISEMEAELKKLSSRESELAKEAADLARGRSGQQVNIEKAARELDKLSREVKTLRAANDASATLRDAEKRLDAVSDSLTKERNRALGRREAKEMSAIAEQLEDAASQLDKAAEAAKSQLESKEGDPGPTEEEIQAVAKQAQALTDARDKARSAAKTLKESLARQAAGAPPAEARRQAREAVKAAQQKAADAAKKAENLSPDLEATLDASSAAAQETADSLQELSQALEASSKKASDSARESSRSAAEASKELKSAAAGASPEDRKQPLAKADAALEDAKKALASVRAVEAAKADKNAKMAAEQDGLSKMGEAMAKMAEDAQAPPAGRDLSDKAKQSLEEAREAAEQGKQAAAEASQAHAKGDADQAAQKAQQAAKSFEKARAKAAEVAKELASRMSPEALEKARKEQLDLSRKLDDVAKSLEEMADKHPKNDPLRQAAERSAEATDASQSAAAKLEEQRPQSSGMDQMKSSAAMEEAREAIEKAMQKEQKRREEKRKRLKQIEKAQKELEDKTRELAESLKNKSPKGSQSLSQAGESMQKANQSFQREQPDTEQAEKKQEEAQEYLEEARSELAEQERKYQDLQEEELLFNMAKELKKLIEVQKAVNEQTAALAETAAQRGGFTRALRRQARELAKKQMASHDRLEEMKTALEEEKIVAFTFMFEEVTRDMKKVSERLRKKKAERFTQALEQDVLDNLNLLAQTIRDEMTARRQMKKQKKQDQQPQGKKPLVSKIAELVLLRNMQKRLNDRTRTLIDSGSEHEDGLTPVQRLLAKRLLHQQAKIRDLFQKLIEQPPEAPQPDKKKEDDR